MVRSLAILSVIYESVFLLRRIEVHFKRFLSVAKKEIANKTYLNSVNSDRLGI